MKNKKSGVSVDDGASHNGDVIYYSEDSPSDTESISLKGSVPTQTGDTGWCFEDDISGNICVCGALGRAHKDCPLNRDITSRWVTVNLHDGKLGKCHLPSCVVQVFGDRCLLFCHKGVPTTGYAKSQLTTVTGDVSISVDNWRTTAKTSLRDVASDSESLEECNCGLAKPAVEHVVDLTEDPTVMSSADGSAVASNTWVSTPLYSLHVDKKRESFRPMVGSRTLSLGLLSCSSCKNSQT